MIPTARPLRCAGLLAATLFVVFSVVGPTAHAAPPGIVTPVAPTGVIASPTLAFTWEGASDATFYYLQINDATASPRIARWYPAAQACPGASATCYVVVSTGFAVGPGIWWVRPWNPEGYGPWSVGTTFTVSQGTTAWGVSLPAADRFQLVMGGVAVLDRETGLVWERTPYPLFVAWGGGVGGCLASITGGRHGWRLPALEELASLLDPTTTSPALPPGHPFGVIATAKFWSTTAYGFDPTLMYYVDLGTGFLPQSAKAGGISDIGRWCVRGAAGAQSPQ
jgi:hypothetical protein